MRIVLLGTTMVVGSVERLDAQGLGGTKPRQLLEMLALDLGTAVPKERLAERLWDGRPPSSWVTTLESYVCLLRRKLVAAGMERTALVTVGGGYRLDPERVSVDVHDVRRLLTTPGPRSVAAVRPSDVADALALVTGELLADEPYAAWAIAERERFNTLLADRCLEGARQAGREQRRDLALHLARAAVDRQVAVEASAQELMRALWHLGRRTEALRAYAALRATLLEEYGLEPGPTSRRLYTAMLRSGSVAAPPDADRLELATLLRLLAQVLESTGLVRDPAAGRLLLATRELAGLAV